jgi:hypothetical protein
MHIVNTPSPKGKFRSYPFRNSLGLFIDNKIIKRKKRHLFPLQATDPATGGKRLGRKFVGP